MYSSKRLNSLIFFKSGKAKPPPVMRYGHILIKGGRGVLPPLAPHPPFFSPHQHLQGSQKAGKEAQRRAFPHFGAPPPSMRIKSGPAASLAAFRASGPGMWVAMAGFIA